MSETTKGKNITPKFVPSTELQSSRVYANYVLVRHTGLDFTLSFMDVPPPTEEQVKLVEKGVTIPVPVQCDLVLPNELIPSFIHALQEQYEKFTKGKPKNEGEVRVEKN